jgi:replicative DNA helicase
VTQACYLSAADVLHGWRDDVLSGRPPTLYPAGAGALARLELGPGIVTLIGGAPGAGKTAFTMQLLLDALRLTPTLKAVVCNIEMPPAVLLDRQLARLSGVPVTDIRHRRLTEAHAGRIDRGLHTLDALAERLAFVRPPYTLDNVAATADAVGADVLLLDYIQRIAPAGEHADRRGAVDATMGYLRQFADAGVAVVVVAAVARSRDSKGRSSYAEGLSLASFRESSELEFGADDAFLLTPDPAAGDDRGAVLLRHLKSRHGEAADLPLRFERRYQRFAAAGEGPATSDRGQLRAALAELWEQTRPADAGGGGDA